jgi:hypothetical protein
LDSVGRNLFSIVMGMRVVGCLADGGLEVEGIERGGVKRGNCSLWQVRRVPIHTFIPPGNTKMGGEIYGQQVSINE